METPDETAGKESEFSLDVVSLRNILSPLNVSRLCLTNNANANQKETLGEHYDI